MFELESATGILSGVSVVLSLLSIWLCQMVQKRVDSVSAEMITDHLKLSDDLKLHREEINRALDALRRECVGRAHYLETRARDSLH